MTMFFLLIVLPMVLFIFSVAWYMANYTELGKDLMSLYSTEQPEQLKPVEIKVNNLTNKGE